MRKLSGQIFCERSVPASARLAQEQCVITGNAIQCAEDVAFRFSSVHTKKPGEKARLAKRKTEILRAW
jgi:hypothetical protein